jgi:hypothetical protein
VRSRQIRSGEDSRRKTRAGQTLDPLRSGVVTVDIDLCGTPQDLLPLLVAVIREGGDIALAPVWLQDLALKSPNVAVRSVRVNPSSRPHTAGRRRGDQ